MKKKTKNTKVKSALMRSGEVVMKEDVMGLWKKHLDERKKIKSPDL